MPVHVNTSNPEFAHEWVTYKDEKLPFDRAVWRVCARCGRVARNDGKLESCRPQVDR